MNKRKTFLIFLLLLSGIAVLTYPTASDWVNRLDGSHAIQELQTQLESADIAKQRALAEAYNAKLRESDEGTEEEYNGILDIAHGMMGSLQIPKINVDLPIYHGVSEDVLAKGIGHMPQTAFPIGGEGNHAVLTGHTGLPSAKLFTDLTELTEGDIFYISVLGQTLAYQVDQIKVVLPDDGQDLVTVPGKDYCTLVTCTPYGINSHRLLVRGERTEPEQAEGEQPMQTETKLDPMMYLWLLPAMIAAVMLIVLMIILKKKN